MELDVSSRVWPLRMFEQKLIHKDYECRNFPKTSSLSKTLSSFVDKSLSKRGYPSLYAPRVDWGFPRFQSGAIFEILVRPLGDLSLHIWSMPFKFSNIHQLYHRVFLLSWCCFVGKHALYGDVSYKEAFSNAMRPNSISHLQRSAFRHLSGSRIIISDPGACIETYTRKQAEYHEKIENVK